MRNIVFIFILFSILLTSCFKSKKDENTADIVIFNTYESVSGYYDSPINNTYTVLKNSSAYSGNYISYTDSINRYSMIFRKKIGDLTTKTITKIVVSAFIKTSDAASEGSIVFSIDSIGKIKYWNGNPVKNIENLKVNEWSQIKLEVDCFKIPESMIKDFEINSVFYNTGKSAISIDDYKVEIFTK